MVRVRVWCFLIFYEWDELELGFRPIVFDLSTRKNLQSLAALIPLVDCYDRVGVGLIWVVLIYE
jgi:hypothetical protein